MPKRTGKQTTIQIRLAPLEKAAFVEAAAIAGVPISAWVRERLRAAAIRELEATGRRVPFLADLYPGVIRNE